MAALLSWINHVDAAATVLSGTAHVGDLALANLADPIVGKRYRSTSLTPNVTADFGANESVSVCALVFPRDTAFPTAGTVTWLMDADGGTAGSGAAHNSGAVAIDTVEGYGYHLYVPASPVTARYVRASLSVSGVTYVDIGRLWVGEKWTPAVDVAGGYEDDWTDMSKVHVAVRSGAEYPDRRPRQRLMAFALDALDVNDRDDVRELGRIVGIAEQVLFCLDPNNFAKETVLGRMATTTPIRHRALSDVLYAKAFEIRESL